MSVNIQKKSFTRQQAKVWIEERGIDRLPALDEVLRYVPPGGYNEYNLTRTNNDYFELTAHVISN